MWLDCTQSKIIFDALMFISSWLAALVSAIFIFIPTQLLLFDTETTIGWPNNRSFFSQNNSVQIWSIKWTSYVLSSCAWSKNSISFKFICVTTEEDKRKRKKEHHEMSTLHKITKSRLFFFWFDWLPNCLTLCWCICSLCFLCFFTCVITSL